MYKVGTRGGELSCRWGGTRDGTRVGNGGVLGVVLGSVLWVVIGEVLLGFERVLTRGGIRGGTRELVDSRGGNSGVYRVVLGIILRLALWVIL